MHCGLRRIRMDCDPAHGINGTFRRNPAQISIATSLRLLCSRVVAMSHYMSATAKPHHEQDQSGPDEKIYYCFHYPLLMHRPHGLLHFRLCPNRQGRRMRTASCISAGAIADPTGQGRLLSYCGKSRSGAQYSLTRVGAIVSRTGLPYVSGRLWRGRWKRQEQPIGKKFCNKVLTLTTCVNARKSGQENSR